MQNVIRYLQAGKLPRRYTATINNQSRKKGKLTQVFKKFENSRNSTAFEKSRKCILSL